jgi:hypothetical protein
VDKEQKECSSNYELIFEKYSVIMLADEVEWKCDMLHGLADIGCMCQSKWNEFQNECVSWDEMNYLKMNTFVS